MHASVLQNHPSRPSRPWSSSVPCVSPGRPERNARWTTRITSGGLWGRPTSNDGHLTAESETETEPLY